MRLRRHVHRRGMRAGRDRAAHAELRLPETRGDLGRILAGGVSGDRAGGEARRAELSVPRRSGASPPRRVGHPDNGTARRLDDSRRLEQALSGAGTGPRDRNRSGGRAIPVSRLRLRNRYVGPSARGVVRHALSPGTCDRDRYGEPGRMPPRLRRRGILPHRRDRSRNGPERGGARSPPASAHRRRNARARRAARRQSRGGRGVSRSRGSARRVRRRTTNTSSSRPGHTPGISPLSGISIRAAACARGS